MMHTLLELDRGVTTFIVHSFPHNPVFDLMFQFLSLEGLSVVVWIIALVAFVRFQMSQQKKFILYILITLSTTYFFVNILYKNIVQRMRPWMAWQMPQHVCPWDFSFPSGHASGAFAAAVIFAHFDKKRKWFYYTVAVLISFSRVYLVCHYVSDVIAGALIGYGIGALSLLSLRSKKQKKI